MCAARPYRSNTSTVAGCASSRHRGSLPAISSSTSHGRAGGSGSASSTGTTWYPSPAYIEATEGVEQATTARSGPRSWPSASVRALIVTCANESVVGTSWTATTRDRMPARTENRSTAASLRSNGTGLRRVVWWFADVTAQTTVAPG